MAKQTDSTNREMLRSHIKAGVNALEAAEFSDALASFQQALELDSRDTSALLGALQASCGVESRADLVESDTALTENEYYQRLLPLADEALRQELQGYADTVSQRLAAQATIRAKEAEARHKELEEKKAAYLAGADAETKSRYAAEAHRRKAEEERNEAIYQSAMAQKGGRFSHNYAGAARQFQSIRDYKDAEAQAAECEKLAARTALWQRIVSVGLLIIFAALVVAFCFGRGYNKV